MNSILSVQIPNLAVQRIPLISSDVDNIKTTELVDFSTNSPTLRLEAPSKRINMGITLYACSDEFVQQIPNILSSEGIGVSVREPLQQVESHIKIVHYFARRGKITVGVACSYEEATVVVIILPQPQSFMGWLFKSAIHSRLSEEIIAILLNSGMRKMKPDE